MQKVRDGYSTFHFQLPGTGNVPKLQKEGAKRLFASQTI